MAMSANFKNMRRLHTTLVLAVCLMAGCAADTGTRLQRADLAIGAAADGVRIAIQTGYLKGDAISKSTFAVNAANNVSVKAHAAYKAGDTLSADFWLDRLNELLTGLPVPTGAN